MKRMLALAALLSLFAATLASAAPASPAKPERRVTITVTRQGFVPATVKLKAGQPVRLVVTRKEQRTCATDIVIRELKLQKPLPLNRPVEIAFTPQNAGSIRYACAMDMIAGTLSVE